MTDAAEEAKPEILNPEIKENAWHSGGKMKSMLEELLAKQEDGTVKAEVIIAIFETNGIGINE